MKILVTGGEGQLARCLAERGAGRDDLTVVPVGRRELDLTDDGTIVRAIDRAAPDLVINAAAFTGVDAAETDPRAFAVNRDGAAALARATAAAGVRLVHLSTDYVFDGTGEEARAEDAPTGPINAYGRSKLDGEGAVLAADPDATIVRTAWLYSPFGANFVRTMIAAARTRDLLTVVGDQVGNPTSALDLADGLLAMARAWRGGAVAGSGEIYHLAGTGAASWADLAEAVMDSCAALGAPTARIERIASADWPTPAARPRNSRLDSGKFADHFGVVMPDWRASLPPVVERIVAGQ